MPNTPPSNNGRSARYASFLHDEVAFFGRVNVLTDDRIHERAPVRRASQISGDGTATASAN
jgi:hypothetical protein